MNRRQGIRRQVRTDSKAEPDGKAEPDSKAKHDCRAPDPRGLPRHHRHRHRPGPSQGPLRRAAGTTAPYWRMYGGLKLIGFSVFMYLLHSAGDFREKIRASAAAPTPGTYWPAGTAGGTSRSPHTATTPRSCPVPGATGLITLEGQLRGVLPAVPGADTAGLRGHRPRPVRRRPDGLGRLLVRRRAGHPRRHRPARRARGPGWPRPGSGRCWPGSGVEWAALLRAPSTSPSPPGPAMP